jgi:hypothetical protein
MEAMKELWAFMRVRKAYWLAPIVIILLLLGALMILGTNYAAISPFIYMM